jgi:hypothetical protein
MLMAMWLGLTGPCAISAAHQPLFKQRLRKTLRTPQLTYKSTTLAAELGEAKARLSRTERQSPEIRRLYRERSHRTRLRMHKH